MTPKTPVPASSDAAAEASAPVVRVYDFRRPQTLARDDVRVLEMAFDTFARQWGTQLTQHLHTYAQITCDQVAMTTYDEYVRSLPTTSAMVLCTIDQARSNAVLQLPTTAALTWVDLLLGGAGSSDDVAERELTDIETTLVADILNRALADIRYAFAVVMPLDVRVRSVQYNPQLLQVVAASEQVISASFTVHVADNVEQATLMIPAEILLAGLRSSDRADARTSDDVAAAAIAADRLSGTVQQVPVDVRVRFAPRVAAAQVLAGLHVGDMVALRHPVHRPLDVVVDGVLVATANQGATGSRLAAQILTKEKH